MFDWLIQAITFSGQTMSRLYGVIGGVGVVVAVIVAGLFVVRFSQMVIGGSGSDSAERNKK